MHGDVLVRWEWELQPKRCFDPLPQGENMGDTDIPTSSLMEVGRLG